MKHKKHYDYLIAYKGDMEIVSSINYFSSMDISPELVNKIGNDNNILVLAITKVRELECDCDE